MHECGKATLRRLYASHAYARYFAGDGIDIGSGNDPLEVYRPLFPAMRAVRSYDQEDGDAQTMANVADEAYDFVHSSHCLEHLPDPALATRNWVRITKPGGYVVVVVPDEDMYEQGVWPSTFNPDHKHAFTISKRASWCADSVNVTTLIDAVNDVADCVALLRLDATFNPALTRTDHTRGPIGESAIEFVLRKRERLTT